MRYVPKNIVMENTEFECETEAIPEEGILGSVKIRLPSLPQSACNHHGTAHAMSIALYMELISS